VGTKISFQRIENVISVDTVFRTVSTIRLGEAFAGYLKPVFKYLYGHFTLSFFNIAWLKTQFLELPLDKEVPFL